MAEINKKNQRRRWPAWILILPFIDFLLLLRYLLRNKNIALFNPKGIIASQQRSLMVFSIIILFAIAIPAMFMLYFVAWKYRESNPKPVHAPEKRSSKAAVTAIWAVPTFIMLIITAVMWPATHQLAPQKQIEANAKPLTIQVISLRWKWVFLYPEQNIATVNFVQLPVDTPITFEMTADETPMSSFWIPNLGGQLYTMTSHVNRLNLMAEKPGDYPGSTPEINGNGFAGMRFTARASSGSSFDSWVESMKQSTSPLDSATYQELLKPSEYVEPAYYSTFEPDLYARVIAKYEGPGGHTH